jgi:hypothetical protein
MSQYRFFNTIPQINSDTKLAGWYKIDNKNNAALRVYDSNVLLPGIIRFNEKSNLFQGFNGKTWVDFYGTKGDKGDKGDNFNQVVRFNNMPVDLNNVIKNVECGEVFKTKIINGVNSGDSSNENIVDCRTIISDTFKLNDVVHKSLNIGQSENNIILKSLPQPFTWDLSCVSINDNYLNSDGSLKSYGNIMRFNVEKGISIKRGQFVMSLINNDGDLVIRPVSYKATKSRIPNFYMEPVNVVGVAIENIVGKSSSQTCRVCISGITSVLVGSEGGYLSADMNIKSEGSIGIINHEGKIIKTNNRPIYNFIVGGQFMEKKILKGEEYIMFNVNISISFD